MTPPGVLARLRALHESLKAPEYIQSDEEARLVHDALPLLLDIAEAAGKED